MWRTILVAISVLLSGCGDEKPTYDVLLRQGKLTMVKIPAAQAMDTAYYYRVIERECPGNTFCHIVFFAGTRQVSYPMTDLDLAARTAIFNRSPSQNFERLSLACRLKATNTATCFN